MAYRRRQQQPQQQQQQGASTLRVMEEREEGIRNLVKPQRPHSAGVDKVDEFYYMSSSSSSGSSLAEKAMRASSANRDASLSSSGVYSARSSSIAPKDSNLYEYTSAKSSDDSKNGFWGVLARKAKAILDDNEETQKSEPVTRTGPEMSYSASGDKYLQSAPHESHQRIDNPALKKGLSAITSSINYIGNAVEGGLNMVENRTAGLIKETRKHIRKKPNSNNQATDHFSTGQQPQMKTQMHPQSQTDLELQLKASRDVAMAMAAKAKLLLRELKTVKADLAFAKERCAQLEEENKILRENRDRGEHPEDDEMIRLQLETLLGEKARLAHENSVYARENRFLREIVEYHQLTMQDVVYLDERTEEVSEVYPIKVPSGSGVQSVSSISPPTPPS